MHSAWVTKQDSVSKKKKIKKWTMDITHFSKEGTDVANNHMEKSSSSLVIREMQIKTTMRNHLTPVRLVIINKSGTRDAGEDVEK